MKTKSSLKYDTSNPVFKNAMRDYKTYVERCKSRNLTPIPFDIYHSIYMFL